MLQFELSGRRISLACAAHCCAGAGASAPRPKVFLSAPCHASHAFLRPPLQHGLNSYTTTTQSSVQHRHHGEQQEHWHDWNGRHGEDVLAATEYRGLEVSILRATPRVRPAPANGKSSTFSLTLSCYDDRECIWLEYGARPSWCRLGSQHLDVLLSMM
jgi:hypothetical protein